MKEFSKDHTERPLRILTWHVHGSYLYYLLHTPHEFYIPVNAGRTEAYGGLPPGNSYPWPSNAHEVPVEQVKNLDLDVILFQTKRNYLQDQYEILSDEQQRLPKMYLEHDPPCEHPTDTMHWVDDPNILLVHVTHFNNLMWDSNRTPTLVIEHGVVAPENLRYTGALDRGIVVVNNLKSRGRRLGADIFEQVQSQIPLDLVGMNSEEMQGLGEVSHDRLYAFEARYRFFFNPIRYTSLGLAVCEAMMIGMPIIGLATTEMVQIVENGVSGYVDTNVDKLVEYMQYLLEEPEEAYRLGSWAQQQALERFNINRFIQDWDQAFSLVAGRSSTRLDHKINRINA
jgi:glycosyltransferase involved in cell wall biosynthesis